jgi:glycosyltransferase involved in cell wall biosynthesis
MAQKFRMTFSYRSSNRYDIELKRFLTGNVQAASLFSSLSLAELTKANRHAHGSSFLRILDRLDQILSIVFIYPLFLYELLKFCALFWREPPTILHINNGGYPGARSARSAACAGKICGVRTVLMTVNNIAIPVNRLSRLIETPIDKLVARSVTKFITSSDLASESIRNVLKIEARQIETIDNAVNRPPEVNDRIFEKLDIDADVNKIIIGVIANLEPRKGHHIFFDALLILVTRDASLKHRLKVLIIGEGPLNSELRELSARYGLQDIVEFLGYRDDYYYFYNLMDFMVLASLSQEDSPLCTIEAMSMGVPSIVSDFAGLSKQIVDGVNGFLFPIGDKEALARAISNLIYDDEIRASMGKAALSRYLTSYTPEVFTKNYFDLYNSLESEICT